MMIQNKVVRNASWIIVCQIIQSCAALVITMFTARYLGPSNFGLINYASSIVAFVVPIMQLGLTNIMVQEFIQRPDEEGKTLGTSITLSMISAFLCIIGVISFSAIANKGETETIIVVALYSLILIFQGLNHVHFWFEAKYLSKYTSIISLAAYFVVTLYKIYLLVTEKSIYWFAVSNAVDYMLISGVSLLFYKKKGGQKLSFSGKLAMSMLSQSKYFIISNLMITVFAQTDRVMLKLMISDEATGYYSAAIACAGITSFVFTAIINSMRPLIFESKEKSNEQYEKNLSRLYCVIIYLSLLQSLVMTLAAGLIIHILYGEAYVASVPALQLVVWYTTFSYLGGARDIWILTEKKQNYLWIIYLSGAIINVVINLLLIPRIGIMGAAAASLITQIFTNVIIGFFIKPFRQNNLLMLRGLNPMLILGFFKKRKPNQD